MPYPKRYQQGFLLPLALFVLLVMGLMAALMAQKINLSISTNLLQAASSQAAYAAKTGTQLGLHDMFFQSVDRRQIDSQCLGLSRTHSFNSAGLNQCEIMVSCTCVYEDGNTCDPSSADNYNGARGIEHSIYEIISQSSCGQNTYLARGQHSVQAEFSTTGFNVPSELPDYRGHDRLLNAW